MGAPRAPTDQLTGVNDCLKHQGAGYAAGLTERLGCGRPSLICYRPTRKLELCADAGSASSGRPEAYSSGGRGSTRIESRLLRGGRRDTAELRQQRSEEEDRGLSSRCRRRTRDSVSRSHGVGVADDRDSDYKDAGGRRIMKRLQREEERRKSNSSPNYQGSARTRLWLRGRRDSRAGPPQQSLGLLFGEDEGFRRLPFTRDG